MTVILKKSLSVLLAVLMAVSLFTVLPISASAKTITETGSEEINTDTINAGTYSLYDYTGSHFKVMAFTSYCDSDGFDLGNSNSVSVSALNGETITKLVFTIGRIEKDSAPYSTLYNAYAVRSGDTFVFDGLNDSVINFHTFSNDGLMQIKKIEVFYSHTYDLPPHTHNDITFTEWESENSLPNESGDYVLMNDVTLSYAWSVPSGTTNLCLNGYSITLTGSSDCVIDICNDASVLNLYDEENNGIITGGNNTLRNTQNGGGVAISAAATFNMYGGKIYNNTAGAGGGGVAVSNESAVFNMRGGIIDGNTASGAGAGGVRVFRGTFNMYGGTISNNTARDNGGGVNIDGGYGQSFNMSGGSITGNTALNYGGGGVGIDDGGTLTMTGGSITGNTAASNGNNRYGGGVMINAGATFNASGGTVVSGNNYGSGNNDVYLAANKVINVIGAFTFDANIGVAMENTTGIFTSGYSSNNSGRNPADDFFSNNGSYTVALNNSEATIRRYNIIWKNYDNSTITTSECSPGVTPVFNGILPVKPSDASNAYVFAGWTPSVGAVNSDMTYTAAYNTVEKHEHDGVNFTYWNSTTSLPTTAGNYALNGDVTISSTWIVPSGTTNLCLNGHKITKTGVGGVIKNENADTTLAIYDCGSEGTITGGYYTASGRYGAGIEFLGGHLILNGGIISGNNMISTGTGGGGVKLDDNEPNDGKTSTFVMNGGTITGNSAAYGGGVYVRRGTFTLNGGTISNNTARTTDGGGVHIYGGEATFNMTGGTITGNNATCGGGIGVSGGGNINISGGTIQSNNATTAGGGLCNQRGEGGTTDLAASISISGNPVITDNTVNNSTTSNIYLVQNNGTDIPLTVSGELTEGAEMGVSLRAGTGVFTTGYSETNSAAPNAFFFSDNSSYAVGFTGSEAQLTSAYTITWSNYNGTVLATQALGYGATPSYEGTVPTKPSDSLYTYTFTGWSPTVANVTGDVTYTAQFEAERINPLDESYDSQITASSAADTDNNAFGLPGSLEYTKGRLLGVQRKELVKTNTAGTGLRFVAEISSDLLSSDDFGFEIMRNTFANTQAFSDAGGFTFMENNKTDSSKITKVSCRNTTNNIVSADYGDRNASSTPYKYVTLTVNNIPDDAGVAVRFYVTIDGTTYYGKYTNYAGNDFRGCCASYSAICGAAD